MRYLLDTNVISEVMTPSPDERVTSWFATVEENLLYISVVTLAEIRFGIERMATGRRRKQLETWLFQYLPIRFEGRIIQVDTEIALDWGAIMARRQKMGRVIATMDAFLAASARRHAMTLVTRNVADFNLLDVDVINPWNTGQTNA